MTPAKIMAAVSPFSSNSQKLMQKIFWDIIIPTVSELQEDRGRARGKLSARTYFT
jgi:hypothetical protein